MNYLVDIFLKKNTRVPKKRDTDKQVLIPCPIIQVGFSILKNRLLPSDEELTDSFLKQPQFLQEPQLKLIRLELQKNIPLEFSIQCDIEFERAIEVKQRTQLLLLIIFIQIHVWMNT
jgi:hypothetical protein